MKLLSLTLYIKPYFLSSCKRRVNSLDPVSSATDRGSQIATLNIDILHFLLWYQFFRLFMKTYRILSIAIAVFSEDLSKLWATRKN